MSQLPVLRKKLGNVSSKNKSLQDIFQSMKYGSEVKSVSKQPVGIHNTKLVLIVDQGLEVPPRDRFIERTHFYNRLDLETVLIGLTWSGTDIKSIIQQLNLQGCDFNEDDIELVSGQLQAKETSLGYFSKTELPPIDDCKCFYDHQILDWYAINQDVPTSISFAGSDASFSVNKIVGTIVVNGKTTVHEFLYETPVIPIVLFIELYRDMFNLVPELEIEGFLTTPADMAHNPIPLIKNISTECLEIDLSFELVAADAPPEEHEILVALKDLTLCPKGTIKISCPNVSDRIMFLTDPLDYVLNTGVFLMEMNGSSHSVRFNSKWDNQGTLMNVLRNIWGYNRLSNALLNFYEEEHPDLPPGLVYQNNTGECLHVKLKYIDDATQKEEVVFEHIFGNRTSGEANIIEVTTPSTLIPLPPEAG